MRLFATIRIQDTVVAVLSGGAMDAGCLGLLNDLVGSCIADGISHLVLDVGPGAVVDFAVARALVGACRKLGGPGHLRICNVDKPARARLRILGVVDEVPIFDGWREAVDAHITPYAA